MSPAAVLRGRAPAGFFRSPAVYHEVQHFQAWVYGVAYLPGIVLAAGAGLQLFRGIPFGSRPMSDAGLLALSAAVLGFPLLLQGLLLRMETVVDQACLTVRFGTFGWVHRTAPLESIRSVTTVEFRPIRDFGGWGIRYAKGTWCYTTRGRRGVMVSTAEGKNFIVGSQTPELLESALRSVMKQQR
jgi:hypothetical protein